MQDLVLFSCIVNPPTIPQKITDCAILFLGWYFQMLFSWPKYAPGLLPATLTAENLTHPWLHWDQSQYEMCNKALSFSAIQAVKTKHCQITVSHVSKKSPGQQVICIVKLDVSMKRADLKKYPQVCFKVLSFTKSPYFKNSTPCR